jgi:2-polyprenyl-3-methyl-5-hydroxy-6-metoxy-1,4-benzoquinol methylase
MIVIPNNKKEDWMNIAQAMYDAIGTRFEDFANSAAQRGVETETFFSMVGDVQGKSVLDLACGYGYFGRELKRRGAARVVGVDISPAMIELATQLSAEQNDSIAYLVRNVAEMERICEFDLVTAAWLFNYARSPEELKRMFKAVASNLKRDGRVVAYTVEPDYQLAKGDFAQYGVHVIDEVPHFSGYRHNAEFVTNPPSAFAFYRWSRRVYESAMFDAGLRHWSWQKPIISAAQRARYPDNYWAPFEANCLQTGLVCNFEE